MLSSQFSMSSSPALKKHENCPKCRWSKGTLLPLIPPTSLTFSRGRRLNQRNSASLASDSFGLGRPGGSRGIRCVRFPGVEPQRSRLQNQLISSQSAWKYIKHRKTAYCSRKLRQSNSSQIWWAWIAAEHSQPNMITENPAVLGPRTPALSVCPMSSDVVGWFRASRLTDLGRIQQRSSHQWIEPALLSYLASLLSGSQLTISSQWIKPSLLASFGCCTPSTT